MFKSKASMVGYVEDVDEEIGSTIGVESTRRYARSEYARSEAPRSPERSNTSKPRNGRDYSDSDSEESASSLSSAAYSDDESHLPPKRGKMRPVAADQRRPTTHPDREPRPYPPRDTRAPREVGERRRIERKPAREDDDQRRMRPEPKDADARAPREPRGPKKAARPGPPKHAASQPVVNQAGYRRGQFEDPAAYGVQQPAASSTQRPRAHSRPASYYAGQPPQQPPPLDMAWNGPPPYGMPGFQPAPMFSPLAGPPGGPPMHPGMPPPQSPMGMPPPPPGSFFPFDGPMGPPGPPPLGPPGPPPPGEHLRHRFDGRPSSAHGYGSPQEALEYFPEDHDGYVDEPSQKVARRPSRPKKQQPMPEERKRMMHPPEFAPKRTQSARPTPGAYKSPLAPREPPREQPRDHMREQAREHIREQQRERAQSRPPQQRPSHAHRRSVGFVGGQGFVDDDEYVGSEVDLYQAVSPTQRRNALTRPRRSHSVAYDQHGFDIVPAGNRGRRGSMYGPGPHDSFGGASFDEDSRYLDALRYQEDVSGVMPMPLTAESLRKASKRGELASSRSTRSSGSHDESDYRRSHTTGHTTQSSTAHDDFTIKVSGQAVVKMPGAQIECDGGEITFSSGRAGAGAGAGAAGSGPPPGASRAGSDKESTVYQLDDARSSRMERKALPPHRPRANSQSDVHSRIHAPLRGPLEHAPYEHIPYEPYDSYEHITYDYAPYDPSLAAHDY